MSARIHALVLFGFGLASMTALGCGKAKSDAASDGASSDGAACDGPPIDCVPGGPSGTGVACAGGGHSGTCVGGVWICPKGMVDEHECTCGEPGLSCTPQVCTKDGPICLDAGADDDAGAGDAASDGGSSDGAACEGLAFYCVQGGPSGTGVACGGFGHAGTCVDGVWTCPTGMVDTKECTCGEPGLSCTPQVCTKDGPVCLDAGADGDAF